MNQRRQNGKHRKRLKSFHKGRGIAKKFLKISKRLPEVVLDDPVDYGNSEFKVIRGKAKDNKGDAL